MAECRSRGLDRIADATEVVDVVATWVEKSRQIAAERPRPGRPR